MKNNIIKIIQTEFELGKKYKFHLTDDTKIKINNILMDNYDFKLPDDFGFVKESIKNDYGSGTFNKRLKKYIKKILESDIEVEQNHLSMIGDILLSDHNEAVYLEFYNEFWESSYVDSGSCWFTFNFGAPLMIKDNGGIFIKVYDKNEKYNGRFVILPSNEGDNTISVFNFSGKLANMRLNIWKALANKLNCDFTSSCRMVNNKYSNLLYTHNSGAIYGYGDSMPKLINFKFDETNYKSARIYDKDTNSTTYVLHKDCIYDGKEGYVLKKDVDNEES